MRFLKILLIMTGFGLMASCAHHSPSVGAEHMAGAEGTFEFKPVDWQQGQQTWWKDSDGIAPGIAGCHIGTDASGKPNGRHFGEACLDNGLLVESNPEANKLHSHADDTGHPDMFNCNNWCKEKGSRDGGHCVSVKGPAPCARSARCECN